MLLDHFKTLRSLFSHESPPPPLVDPWESPTVDRLESWKEIAGYLKRDVSTVQRWEKREGLPVHRHAHDKLGTVYAHKHELDSWRLGRAPTAKRSFAAKVRQPRGSWILLTVLTGVALLSATAIRQFLFVNPGSSGPLRVLPLTSYPGG